MSSSPSQPSDDDLHARWRPCERNCQRTLRWPVVERLDDSATQPTEHNPAGPPPAPPMPAHSLLAMCGEVGLRRLVHRHMMRLRLTPLLSEVGECFDCVVERVGDHVIESCGGPLYYSERHARLQAGAGLPLLLNAAGRQLWLVQLWHAMHDVGLPEPLRRDFWEWAEPLSICLLAPRARQGDIVRYPWEVVSGWFTADGDTTDGSVSSGLNGSMNGKTDGTAWH